MLSRATQTFHLVVVFHLAMPNSLAPIHMEMVHLVVFHHMVPLLHLGAFLRSVASHNTVVTLQIMAMLRDFHRDILAAWLANMIQTHNKPLFIITTIKN